MIHEWPFHYQASGTTGTQQLGAANLFAGAPGTETPHFYFDDVEFIELSQVLSAPIIDIDDGPNCRDTRRR